MKTNFQINRLLLLSFLLTMVWACGGVSSSSLGSDHFLDFDGTPGDTEWDLYAATSWCFDNGANFNDNRYRTEAQTPFLGFVANSGVVSGANSVGPGYEGESLMGSQGCDEVCENLEPGIIVELTRMVSHMELVGTPLPTEDISEFSLFILESCENREVSGESVSVVGCIYDLIDTCGAELPTANTNQGEQSMGAI